MPRIKDDERALALVPLLIVLAVVVIIVGVAWHLKNTNNTPYGQAQRLAGPGDNFPQGNLSNTYTFAGRNYPNLSDSYKLIRRTTSITTSSPLPGSIEADYITSNTIAQVHTDMTGICSAHGFVFSTALSYPVVECFAHNTAWLFNIMPASSLIDQDWYQQSNSQQAISALDGYVWVQVESGEVVNN